MIFNSSNLFILGANIEDLPPEMLLSRDYYDVTMLFKHTIILVKHLDSLT